MAAVARADKLVYFEALGMLNIEQQKPMPRRVVSHLFYDPEITSTAVLQLYEAGKFELDDPIQKYLLQFSDSGC